MKSQIKGRWALSLQVFFFFAFILFFYFNELATLSILQKGTGLPYFTEATHDSLLLKAPLYIPGNYWLYVIPIFFAGIALLFPLRARFLVLFFLGSGYLLLLLANEIYSQFFSTAITLRSFGALHQLPDVFSSVTASFTSTQLWRVLAFLCLFTFPIVFFWKKRERGKWILGLEVALALAFFLFSFRIFLLINDAAQFQGNVVGEKVAIIPGFKSSRRDFALTFGVGNLMLDELTSQTEYKKQGPLTKEEEAFVMGLFNDRYQSNQTCSPFFGLAKGKNIILISLESFQHFLINLKLKDWEVCPNLNGIIQNSLNFDYVFDNIAMGGSSDAEFMVMTGLLPDVKTISVFEHPKSLELLYLPNSVRKFGYNTASFHGNFGDFYDRINNHKIFGFEKSFFLDSFSKNIIHMGIADKTFFPESAEKLSRMDTPFFAYLISITSHHPFQSPPGMEDIDTGFPKGSGPEAYLHSVNYTDQALGLFFEKLRELNLFENSIFVIFGDHAAPLSQEDHALIEKTLGYSVNSPQELRVPFCIYIPGLEPELMEEMKDLKFTFGGLHDLFPTVLHLLGEEIPFGLFGTHLFLPPAEKGVELNYRIVDGFGFEGRLYQCETPDCWPVYEYTDQFDPLESKTAFEISFTAKDYYYLHRFIYEKNAQKESIKFFQQSSNKTENPATNK